MTPASTLCIGDVMVDVLARLPGPLEIGSDRPAPIQLLGGGSAANTAAWLGHSGVPVTLAGRIGADAFGRRTIDELTASGVHLALTEDPGRPTGCCIVLVSADGERTMVPDAGANWGLTPADLPAALFGSPGHLHLSGYTLFGAARPAGRHALAAARSTGLTISVDAASAAPIAAVGAAEFLSWLGPDLLLLANLDEARVLTGREDPETAAADLGRRTGRAVVKLGAGGAIWSDGDTVVHQATAPLEPLDSTGAGDAFAAGFLAAQAAGATPADGLQAANALAAEACGRVGGRPPAAG